MLLIILALFLAGGGILSSGIHAKLWQSLEAQIVRELTGQQENTLVYIRNAFPAAFDAPRRQQ